MMKYGAQLSHSLLCLRLSFSSDLTPIFDSLSIAAQIGDPSSLYEHTQQSRAASL